MISSIFLCHGGPTLVVEQNRYTDFLKGLGKKLTPKAVSYLQPIGKVK